MFGENCNSAKYPATFSGVILLSKCRPNWQEMVEKEQEHIASLSMQ